MKVKCAVCKTRFEAKRSSAKYCSARCRQRARRSPGKPAAAARSTRSKPEPPSEESGFERATRRELESMDKLDSMLGQQALTIAKRMANGAETGSAIASLSKEHSRLMTALGATGGAASDPVDEVRRRRERKQSAARQATP